MISLYPFLFPPSKASSLKSVIGEDWKMKTFNYKTLNAKKEEVTKSVDYKDLWHLLSVATSDVYLYEYAKEKLGFDDKSAKAFSKIKLKKDLTNRLRSDILCIERKKERFQYGKIKKTVKGRG